MTGSQTLPDRLVGQVLADRYLLVAPIGAGASSQVYLATDRSLDRQVAVKCLRPSLTTDSRFVTRFRSEAKAAAQLGHPNILAVYDWGEEPAATYLVTEVLLGGSLADVARIGSRLSVSQGLLVALQVAQGLNYAHEQGWVHRDIKPANLLFGTEGRLRIADFGLARARAEASWTEPEAMLAGTARYAAPEQAEGDPIDGRADVYSLALTIIESVTGEVPLLADSPLATMVLRQRGDAGHLGGLGPLGAVLAPAIRPHPADRPNAAELIESLTRAARDLARPERLPLVRTEPVLDVRPGAGRGGGVGLDPQPIAIPPNRAANVGEPTATPSPSMAPDAQVAANGHRAEPRQPAATEYTVIERPQPLPPPADPGPTSANGHAPPDLDQDPIPTSWAPPTGPPSGYDEAASPTDPPPVPAAEPEPSRASVFDVPVVARGADQPVVERSAAEPEPPRGAAFDVPVIARDDVEPVEAGLPSEAEPPEQTPSAEPQAHVDTDAGFLDADRMAHPQPAPRSGGRRWRRGPPRRTEVEGRPRPVRVTRLSDDPDPTGPAAISAGPPATSETPAIGDSRPPGPSYEPPTLTPVASSSVDALLDELGLDEASEQAWPEDGATVIEPYDGYEYGASPAGGRRSLLEADEPQPALRSTGRLPHWFPLAILALLILALIAIVATIAARGEEGRTTTEATVPPPPSAGDYVGEPIEDAQADAERHGWLLSITETRQDGTTAGEVIQQEPGPEVELPEGARLSLLVSMGPELRSVPDVVGMGVAEAMAAVDASELAVGDVVERVDEAPAGEVIDVIKPAPETQSITSGTDSVGAVSGADLAGSMLVETGTAIDLIVSAGPIAEPMPSFVGLTLDQALAQADDLGLVVDRTEAPSAVYPVGVVVDTDPPTDTPVEAGDPLTLVVSSGQPYVAIPDVTGLSVAEATSLLSAAGFDVAGIRGPVDQPVISHDPPAGDRHQPGYAVTLRTE